MADLIKKNAVREEAEGFNVGTDFYEALDDRVKGLVEAAGRRADGNGRKTIKARDA